MGRFDSDPDSLEEKLETMRLRNQILTEEAEASEKKALIKTIKRKYGRNWRGSLGDIKDNDSLRQFGRIGKGMSTLPSADSRFRLV